MSTYESYLLPDGLEVQFRDVSPADAELIAESISTASETTLIHRFFTPIRQVPLAVLRQLLNIDTTNSLCFLGEIHEQTSNGTKHRIICGARYVGTDNPLVAEIAITVHDEFQALGLGLHLMELLARQAFKAGVTTLFAVVMSSNTAMLKLARRIAPHHELFSSSDGMTVVMSVEEILSSTKNTPRPSDNS